MPYGDFSFLFSNEQGCLFGWIFDHCLLEGSLRLLGRPAVSTCLEYRERRAFAIMQFSQKSCQAKDGAIDPKLYVNQSLSISETSTSLPSFTEALIVVPGSNRSSRSI